MSRRPAHPSWCANGYRCTADHATGEHRSLPYTMTRHGGRVGAVIATTRREDAEKAEAHMHLWVRLDALDDVGQQREVRELIRILSRALDAVGRAGAPAEVFDRPELRAAS